MEAIHHAYADHLFQAILTLQTVDECYDFFEDVCTIKEIQEIAQRFEVAAQLRRGKSYSDVNQSTGASTATICRVKKCLMYGSSGYRLVLERLEAAAKEA